MVNENSATSDRLRLLTVFASPVADGDGNRPGGATLDVWGEWEALQAALTLRDPVTGAGTPWDVMRLSPPTGEALGDELARHPVRVVHLAGHGCPSGLVLEDDLGRERLVPTAELIRHLRGRGVDLVVLNACDTAAVAGELVAAGVAKAVVAMREPIYDREAALLAGRLYARLGAGDTLATALSAARESLKERIRSAHPVLGLGNKDPEVRAANWLIVGEGGLRLRSPGEPAGTARLHRLTTPANDPLPFGNLRGFVGRHEELYRLAEWLASPGGRIFVIHGVGGVGKTTLALNAALRASHRFDAFAWASAKDIPELGALAALGAVAAATGGVKQPEESAHPGAALTRRLNGQRVLLVLDNFESVAEPQARELAQVVEGLEPGCGSRVLVTLRPKDRSPLTNDVPKRERIHLETLDLPSALARAFAEVLRQEAPNPPAFTAAPEPEVSEAARLAGLDHLPPAWLVALGELANGAAGHPTLVDLAAASVGQVGWESALYRLGGLRGSDLEVKLDQMIGQMVDALAQKDPDALAVLHTTRLFPEGAPSTLVAWVMAGRVPDESSLIAFEDGAMRNAIASGLLRRNGQRVDLDPPTSRFLELLRPLGTEAERLLRLRQSEVMVSFVGWLNVQLCEGKVTIAGLPQKQTLLSLWSWLAAASRSDSQAAKHLVEHAKRWNNILCCLFEAKQSELLEASRVAATELGDELGEAEIRSAMGDLQEFENNFDAARQNYLKARELFARNGELQGAANCWRRLGTLEKSNGRYPSSRRYLSKALRIYRTIEGGTLGEGNCLLELGELAELEGRVKLARRHIQAAMRIPQFAANHFGLANSLRALGRLYLQSGDYGLSRHALEASEKLSRISGEALGLANSLASLALLSLRENNECQAWSRWAEAKSIFGRIEVKQALEAHVKALGEEFAREGRDSPIWLGTDEKAEPRQRAR